MEGPSLASLGLPWPPLASLGLPWPSLAFPGLPWPPLAFPALGNSLGTVPFLVSPGFPGFLEDTVLFPRLEGGMEGFFCNIQWVL